MSDRWNSYHLILTIAQSIRGSFRHWSLLVLITILAGCISAPRFVVGPQLAQPDARKLCSLISSNRQGSSSFRALLNTELHGVDDDQFSFRYAVVSRGEDALRIDILPDQGAYTLAIITVLGDRAIVVDPERRTVIEGCTTERALERFLGFSGVTQQIVRGLITGLPPSFNCDAAGLYSVAGNAGDRRVILLERGGATAWEIDRELGSVVGVQLLDGADGEYLRGIAKRSVIEPAGKKGVVFKLYDPVRLQVDMIIKKLVLNAVVGDEVFKVETPEGWSREGC